MPQHTAFALIENTIAVQYLLKDDEIILMEASFKGIKIPLERFTDTEMKDLTKECWEEEKSRTLYLMEN